MAVRYTIATGTAAEWAVSALILAVGQPGLDTTNGIEKIGDGASLWGQLPSQVNSRDGSVLNMVALSQAAYDAISPKVASTLYVIV